MRKPKLHRLVRKWHRYLGVIFGIQFLFWTLGGIYFSWTNIKEIRGDNIRKEEPSLQIDSSHATLAEIMHTINAKQPIQHIESVQLADILGNLYYQITYHDAGKMHTLLADAKNGALRAPLNQTEAVAVAKSRLLGEADVQNVQYITSTSAQHEYREKPLPAYAIRFVGTVNTTVYVSTEKGTVQSFRNTRWRIYDFLWMLHTMDYGSRDNLNNTLLKIFSGLGLITILSGFLLYFVSSKKKRQIIPPTIH